MNKRVSQLRSALSSVSEDQPMSHRVRILLTISIIFFLGIEVAVRWGGSFKTCVEIVNKGDSVMEDLVVSLAGSRSPWAPSCGAQTASG